MTNDSTRRPKTAATPADVAEVRSFNRFYTKIIGLLDEQGGPGPAALSLTQVRLLYELASRSDLTARELAQDLSLDAGYLSRLLGGFERRKLIRRTASREDAREKRLTLTAAGRRLFQPLFDQAQDRVGSLLAPLSADDRRRLLAAMATVQALLAPSTIDRTDRTAGTDGAVGDVALREHRAGDIGWVISLHGELYQREYGWNTDFEALVAGIGADFLRRFDPGGERAWIAELDGERVGCAFVVRDSRTVAKLRLVLLDPRARGIGLGRRLVRESIEFARRCGYRKLTLWTNDCLHAARAIYASEGFELVSEEPHHSFGKDLVGQYWALHLTPAPGKRRQSPGMVKPAGRARASAAAR